MQVKRMVGTLLSLSLTVAFFGCGSGTGAAGQGGDEALRVTFDSGGGTYAAAEDKDGNQYTFRARTDENGDTLISEANIKTSDGATLKASLDSQGRPVNFRMSDNTAVDLVYDGGSVDIRLTGEDGTLIEGGQEVNYELAKARVQARRAARLRKSATRMRSSESAKAETLRRGLERYEEIVESIFDEEENPNSPLANAAARALRQAAFRLANFGSGLGFEEVDRDDLGDDVTLDEIPELIRKLAGNTFVLFDAEGFCIELTEVASRLTFDTNGILQSEFDRHLVFSGFSLGGSGEPGITINYSTGTPVNLTPGEDVDFELIVTPVFTGTQLDDKGNVTIERRFQADLTFEIDLFGATQAEVEKLFDAAFLNGELSEDGGLLEFDLVLIDLQDENEALQLGRLRYHNQNSPASARIYTCEIRTGENEYSGIACPVSIAKGEDFPVEFLFGRDEREDGFGFDWFVSDGYGLVVGDPFGPETRVRATAEGFLEITLVVSDVSDDPSVFDVYTCGINVGRGEAAGPPPEGLFIECPPGLNVGEVGYFAVSGPALSGIEFPDWFVFGTSNFFVRAERTLRPAVITDPLSREVEVEFFEPGRFEVAFQGFDSFGHEIFVACEVLIGGLGFDECEANGWYGDGVCDEFCPRLDPDCEFFHDICERNHWYGDGECDDFCPEPDPDCEGEFFDRCAENGWYGDGECDLFCPRPDPDCDVEFYDVCAENGWYDDGKCDRICPHPDPDCEGDFVDVCEQNSWYGDGECDEFCPRPDPDCGLIDICAEEGWYGDGKCDPFCPFPDPDCEEIDICEENGWYGDGECHPHCPMPDPDCNFFDVCAENGWYGDGACDEFCPEPDPDCDFFDVCAENGWYGDGVCDPDCLRPDPDCDDVCAENGWYGDGECDDFCPMPDPDCHGDSCAENGLYGDGVCDDFCPEPDPDCTGFDICAENGWYNNGVCDDFCPEPDPDCTGDICAENGWYGDGTCDDFCPEPDPDCTP